MDNSQTSPLLRLPPELRNRIYDLTLISEDNVLIARHVHILRYRHMKQSDPDHWGPPSLLGACRQIRAEALKIYYRQNTFQVLCEGHPNDRLLSLLPWLQNIPSAARDELRSVRMEDVDGYVCTLAELLIHNTLLSLSAAGCPLQEGALMIDCYLMYSVGDRKIWKHFWSASPGADAARVRTELGLSWDRDGVLRAEEEQ